MTYTEILHNTGELSLEKTLLSGQCFRWYKTGEHMLEGVALGQFVRMTQLKDGDNVTIESDSPIDVQMWHDYLDLSLDYAQIGRDFVRNEPKLSISEQFARGVHILRQDSWEALCSFIISQNNNITRIRAIIKRLCEKYGEVCSTDGMQYTFPIAQVLACARKEDLDALGCGYRSSYIISAAKMVADGELCLEQVAASDTASARKQLLAIHGVGPKVAECALLYGFHRLECFPIDVHIRRALGEIFGADTVLLSSEYAGIAQQYIFEYMRLQYGREENAQ